VRKKIPEVMKMDLGDTISTRKDRNVGWRGRREKYEYLRRPTDQQTLIFPIEFDADR
jgi:hypothetical protein